MRLYSYRDPAGNFGDDLNPWLWPRLLSLPMEGCVFDAVYRRLGDAFDELTRAAAPAQ